MIQYFSLKVAYMARIVRLLSQLFVFITYVRCYECSFYFANYWSI